MFGWMVAYRRKEKYCGLFRSSGETYGKQNAIVARDSGTSQRDVIHRIWYPVIRQKLRAYEEFIIGSSFIGGIIIHFQLNHANATRERLPRSGSYSCLPGIPPSERL